MKKGPSMSEHEPLSASNPFAEGVAPDGNGDSAAGQVSAGALLRQSREAAGMHIAALAVSLKVPVKKLEALEQDRFDLLPDAVFVRALASSVCRTLKLDPAQVLARLPHTPVPQLMYASAGINTPFRSPGDGPGPSIWTQVSRPAVLAGLVLVLGAVVLIFLPAMRQDGAHSNPVAPAPAPVAGADPAISTAGAPSDERRFAVLTAPPRVEAATAAPQPEAGPAAAMPALLVVQNASVLPQAPSVTPPNRPAVATAPAVLEGVAAPAKAASQASASGIVTFRAKGESWIEVTDARGAVVLRRTLAAGEVAGASGALPLAAVIGRADATQVQVRGQAFDLAAVTKDNVARFEVK